MKMRCWSLRARIILFNLFVFLWYYMYDEHEILNRLYSQKYSLFLCFVLLLLSTATKPNATSIHYGIILILQPFTNDRIPSKMFH